MEFPPNLPIQLALIPAFAGVVSHSYPLEEGDPVFEQGCKAVVGVPEQDLAHVIELSPKVEFSGQIGVKCKREVVKLIEEKLK